MNEYGKRIKTLYTQARRQERLGFNGVAHRYRKQARMMINARQHKPDEWDEYADNYVELNKPKPKPVQSDEPNYHTLADCNREYIYNHR